MFDRFLNPPLQWMQLPLSEIVRIWTLKPRITDQKSPEYGQFSRSVHEDDNVKASYDNPKMRNAFWKNTL